MNYSILIVLSFLINLSVFSQEVCKKAQSWKNKIDVGDEKCIDDWSRIAAFEARKCQCERGYALIKGKKVTAPESELLQLEAMLESQKNQILNNHMYSSCISGYTPTYSKCTRNGGDMSMEEYKNGNHPVTSKVKDKSNTSSINANSGILVKGEYFGLLNGLATNSKNPHFKKMVNSMNKNSEVFAQGRGLITSLRSTNQNDIDLYNMSENIAQAITVGKFFLSLLGKQESSELTPSQKEVNSYITNISDELKVIYTECNVVSTYYVFDEKTLESIKEREKTFDQYEIVTAKDRLAFWKYQEFKGVPNQNQMHAIVKKIDDDETNNGIKDILNQIALISSESPNSKYFLFASNSSVAFHGVSNELAMYKSFCYKALGNESKADEIIKSLKYDVDINSAIKLTQEEYLNNNYYSSIQYCNEVKNYLLNHPEGRLYYDDLYQLDSKTKGKGLGLPRFDMNYILSLGVLSYVKSGQISQAQEAFTYLQQYQKEFENYYQNYLTIKQKKKVGYASDNDVKIAVAKANSIVLATQAHIYHFQEENTKALESINNAIELYDSSPHFRDPLQRYYLWMQFIKADLLVKMDKHIEAKSILKNMKNHINFPTSYGSSNNYKGLDLSEYSFLKIFIRYKIKDYNGALMGLKILKSEQPEIAKFYRLEADIYKILGNKELSLTAMDNYIKLLNSRND